MGKGSSPPPPDYTGAAQAQAQASKENLNIQNFANRPTINTPFGSQSWQTNATVDPATGQTVTQWTQNTRLNPELQQALNSQISLQNDRSQLAGNFMDRVADEYSKPFDYSNLPQAGKINAPGSLTTGFNFGQPLPQVDSGFRDQVANQLMTRMQPIHDYQQNQLETKLANQGFTVGSEGYKRALDELNQRQAAERFQALDQSGNEAQRLFGMQMDTAKTGYNQNLGAAQFANQAAGQQFGLDERFADAQNRLRQQAIAEQIQRRGMSLNEMNALLSGQQVNMPNMPNFNASGQAQTPDLLGALRSSYDAQLGAANAQNAGMNSLLGSAAQLGSAAFMFSDRRLKSNIKRVGEHPIGVGIYDFTMMGMPQRGVIAQEVQAVRPDLVKKHASGFLMVNYGGL